jgi:hypothetical protein
MFVTQLIYESMQKNVDFTDSPFESRHSTGEIKPKIQNVRMTNAESQAVALVAYCLAGLIRKLIMTVTVGKQEDDTSPSTILSSW